MAKVILINPAIVYSRWGAHLSDGSPDSLFIRLGLAYLSAALKANGHEVSLLDFRMLSGWEEYETQLLAQKPDFIGVSVHTIELSIALEAAQRAKRLLPHIKTVAGGPHPTEFPDSVLKNGHFDFVLRGEGEVSLPKLVENPKNFESIFWGETPDLNAIAQPDRDLWTDYKKRIWHEPFNVAGYRFPMPMAEVINTRGCPYSCSFCFGPGEKNMYTKLTKYGKRVTAIRGRSVDNVIAELSLLQRDYGVRSVMFHDDQFIIQKQWIVEFCEALHSSGLAASGLKWVTSCKADSIRKNPHLMKLMAEAGLEMLIIGFESFSPRILRWFNKTAGRDDNFIAAKICKKFGIKVWANYILGIPTDTGWHPEDDLMTVAGVMSIHPAHLSPALFTPIPGSPAYPFYRDRDLILQPSGSDSEGNRGALSPKVKGVDYDFLKEIIMTDADLVTTARL